MHDHLHGAEPSSGRWIVLLPFAAAAIMYVAAAVAENGRGRPWPWWRTALWVLGLGIAALAMSGMPLAAVDRPFTDHAVAHLLVGMIVPLLLVLAAPLTLALRSFAPLPARRLSRALRSMPVRVIAHPVIAALLSVGSLWLLCTTPLYADTAEPLPHLIVMTHFLLSGFLFTAVIAPVDPSPHRSPVGVRLVVLTLALAAHGVLAKALYASASGGTGMLAGLMQVGGVSPVDLQTGAQVMFYGGDLVDLALIVLVLWGWYRAVGRQRARISARTASAVPATASASVPLPQEQRA